jgi:hypothetical protein
MEVKENEKKSKKEEHIEGEKSSGTWSHKNREEGRENPEECGKKKSRSHTGQVKVRGDFGKKKKDGWKNHFAHDFSSKLRQLEQTLLIYPGHAFLYGSM